MMQWADYRARLIDIADRIASEGAKDHADYLRRFRSAYRHLIATVDGTANEIGVGPYGPMDMALPTRPDMSKLLAETDQEANSL